MPTNRLTVNFTASDSTSDERCFLKVLIVLQLTHLADSKFQLSITSLENAYFLAFSLNLFLNSLWPCAILSPSSSWCYRVPVARFTRTLEHSIGFFNRFVSAISFAISPRAPASDRWLRSRPRTRAAAAASGQSVCRPSCWGGR